MEEEVGKWTRWDKRARDLAIFVVGIGIIVNEAIVSKTKDLPTMLFGGGMAGLPFVLKTDEMRRK